MTAPSGGESGNKRIVVDTNLYLSVFLFRGKLVKLVFELVLDNKLDLFVSPELLAELAEKFAEFKTPERVSSAVMEFIRAKATLLTPTHTVEKSRDKDDDYLLELSEEAHANYLLTRDEDLLVLKHWKETDIIMPEDFLPLLREMELL